MSTRTQTFSQRNSDTLAEQILVDTERDPIGHRTQSDQTADAIRSDTERDTIRHRPHIDSLRSVSFYIYKLKSVNQLANKDTIYSRKGNKR